VIYCNYRELPRIVKPNDILYIDDGKIICLVTECDTKGVYVEVKGGGVL
jgi:pyruvate kinase